MPKDNVIYAIKSHTVLLDLSELGSRTTGEISSSAPEVTWLTKVSIRSASEALQRDLKDSIAEA